MNTDEAIAEFRELAPQLAPELSAAPFYVLRQPEELPTPRNTTAYAITGRHLMLRDYLRSKGEWRGWGPAIVLVDECDSRESFLGLAIHELGHHLPLKQLADDVEPTAQERKRQDAKVLAWAAADPDPMLRDQPWAGHGARFVRVVLHLHYRMLWLGTALPLASLSCAGCTYGLSPTWKYVSALGSEPFDLSGKSFREIHATPMPTKFVDLFTADVAAWALNNNHKNGGCLNGC